MANSTFSGPVRSQNGFQEWDGTAWVPVAGGGGGGSTLVLLNNSSGVYGDDNRYSADSAQDPPTGPTAGNIIQLPVIEVGASYKIACITSGNSYDCWALQLPTITGTDASYFASNKLQSIQTYSGGSGFPVATENNSFLTYSGNMGIVDTIFIYGALTSSNIFEITRLQTITVPGFGTLAPFVQSTAAVFQYYDPAPDHFVYPYTQRLPGP
jgi:hypothetical protein